MTRFLARVVSTAIAATSILVYAWYELKAITSVQLDSDVWYTRVGYLGGLVIPERGVVANVKIHVNKVTSAKRLVSLILVLLFSVFSFRLL